MDDVNFQEKIKKNATPPRLARFRASFFITRVTLPRIEAPLTIGGSYTNLLKQSDDRFSTSDPPQAILSV
ncbi:hypothetical protein EB061_07960 [bacterium]|jgi:hypothetical protein|nr:hypothetical protein [bacterium]